MLSRSDYADILLTALSPIVGEIELEKFIQGLKIWEEKSLEIEGASGGYDYFPTIGCRLIQILDPEINCDHIFINRWCKEKTSGLIPMSYLRE